MKFLREGRRTKENRKDYRINLVVDCATYRKFKTIFQNLEPETKQTAKNSEIFTAAIKAYVKKNGGPSWKSN